MKCSDDAGKEYSEGDSYVDDIGKTCTCENSGSFACVCFKDDGCKGCDKLFYNGITFSMEADGKASVIWGPHKRPTAYGEVDRTVYPP